MYFRNLNCFCQLLPLKVLILLTLQVLPLTYLFLSPPTKDCLSKMVLVSPWENLYWLIFPYKFSKTMSSDGNKASLFYVCIYIYIYIYIHTEPLLTVGEFLGLPTISDLSKFGLMPFYTFPKGIFHDNIWISFKCLAKNAFLIPCWLEASNPKFCVSLNTIIWWFLILPGMGNSITLLLFLRILKR